ncbi:MAG: diaminopimelate decarboxylase [Spirochaetales bacterium]|nr:diaminopimelate decarboxylase [Leptospiraceae bacterium]MCP5480516.1 diaminopimelate decarboxylase [Spirochaetales bacterium]
MSLRVPIEPLEYRSGALFFDGFSLESLAENHGTPLYVYSAGAVRSRLAAYRAGIGQRRHQICYAMKANGNLGLLGVLARENCGVDIVSGGELFRALRAGISPERIVFSGVGKSATEMVEGLENEIHLFVVESGAELHLLSQVASARGQVARVSVRVNPDVDAGTHPYIATGLRENKFGIDHEEVLATYRLIQELPGLEARGIGFHIGSQLTDLDGFREAARRIRDLIEALRVDPGVVLSHVDVGGGLGIRYASEEPPSPEDYARLLCEELPYPEMTLVFEPGRNLVGNAGILISRILFRKQNGAKVFFIADAAMNDLIRPSLYGAYHEIWPAIRERMVHPISGADLVGPVCESGDFLARDRELPDLQAGDLVALASAGAYGFVMSSNYNARLRPAEVLIDGGEARLVRARESYDDLVRLETL